MYKERKGGRRTPSYVSSANEYDPEEQNNEKGPNPPSNGDLPRDPEQIAPYPSVRPPSADNENPENPEETDSIPDMQRGLASSDDDLKPIPEDLELNEDDENAGDCDTLMKKGDMVRPQSYDKLTSQDSAV